MLRRSDELSNDEKSVVAGRLAAAKSLLIISHARPDGDALGSMSALAEAARAAGKSAAMLLPGKAEVPAAYGFLFPDDRPRCGGELAVLADAADVVVVVDTCAFGQLDGLESALRPRRERIVVIDHHVTRDEVGSVQWTDPTGAAAGLMVAELIAELAWPVTPAVRDALWTAIATDTGWFRFSNTDGRCLRAAAGLVDAGVRVDELYRHLFQADRPQRVQLLKRMLESLELCCDGRIATMVLRRADFAATGARPDETEDLINEALRMGCVEVAILLVETTDLEGKPCVRGSLRSRGGVDVAAVAGGFGGGGHARAAGLRRAEDTDLLKQRLVEACRKAMGGKGTNS
jgi:bifunctional oligoribonuclease and PAP phosphatase NrnA